MKTLQAEQILRLNCPGFGEESFLSLGKAQPLDKYSVIVVNPVSILHLFDKDLDAVKDIDNKLNEGLTAHSLGDDSLLQSLENDLKTRIFQLVDFLEKGGLLVYFLCRPFIVQGSKISLDNYYWLESLAPDTYTEPNVRHMSAVSHGRIIDPTDNAKESDFANYFKQPGLEWNTIIREDNLTDGYLVLCTAGPRKCISGQLTVGDNDGSLVFLPAPYSPDFDRTLVDCLNLWYDRKYAESGVQRAKRTGDMPALEPPKGFPQPDPSKFLSPKAETGTSSGSSHPRLESPRSSGSYARINPASQSKSGLPPVQKFDSRASRGQPSLSASDARAGMRTDELPIPTVDKTETRSRWERGNLDIELPAQEPSESLPGSAAGSPEETPKAAELLSGSGGPPAQEESEGGYVHPADARIAQRQKGQEPPPLTLFEQLSAAATSEPSRPTLRTSEESMDPSQVGANVEPAAAQELGLSEKEEQSLGHTDYPLAQAPEQTSELPEPPQPQAIGQDLELPQSLPPLALDQGTEQGKDHGTEHDREQSKSLPPQEVEEDLEMPEPLPPPKVEAVSRRASPAEQPSPGSQDMPNNNHETDSQSLPEAKDLIKKMEEISKTMAPDWCVEYTFPDLEELKKERATLSDSIRQTQAKIAVLDSKIALLDGLKNALLAAEGEDLTSACSKVFKRLGWQATPTESESELLLSEEKPEAIAHLARSSSQGKRTDLVELSQSVLNFWGENEVEPKGILVTCTWANRPPAERVDPDYPDNLVDFAEKKHMCLMTTMQLLCMYQDLELNKVEPEEIRRRMMDTNGRLAGFQLETSRSRTKA